MKENNFWKETRVLVTGAGGFIGSHLTETLIEKGAKVTAFVKSEQNTCKNDKTTNLKKVQSNLSGTIEGNIENKTCRQKIKENNPEVIFHLAAEAYVPFSFDHPIETMKTNLIGTLNILHAAMDLKELKQIVCTSSGEIYGNATKGKISEDCPINPISPYAASKAAVDRYCYSYYKTYGLPIAIIRPFNTFGPRKSNHVIPKFVQFALDNKPITIYGNGRQSRDFTYVDDTVEGFMLMGSRKEAIGKAINFGSGKDYSINQIAELVKKLCKSDSEIIHVKERTAEVNRLICDYGLANKLFGWEPKIGLEEGLKRVIKWQKKQLGK